MSNFRVHQMNEAGRDRRMAALSVLESALAVTGIAILTLADKAPEPVRGFFAAHDRYAFGLAIFLSGALVHLQARAFFGRASRAGRTGYALVAAAATPLTLLCLAKGLDVATAGWAYAGAVTLALIVTLGCAGAWLVRRARMGLSRG